MFTAPTIGLLLAFANGANDNFKGVATLFGSGTTSYRRALVWATATTVLGSLAALVLARGLLAAFSGKGLVPPEVVSDPGFSLAVASAAGATILLATRLGLPVSTTHALVGGLVGAGWMASPGSVDLIHLGSGFFAPLLTSPVIAILLTVSLYPALTSVRQRLGIQHETCVCVDNDIVAVLPGRVGAAQAIAAVGVPTLVVGTVTSCELRYRGDVLGWSAEGVLSRIHYLSSGVVCFARSLNDTPKIAALLLAGGALSASSALLGVGFMVAIGGVLAGRRVAETMSHRVTEMTAGQGATANLVTGLIVVGASWFGMPVSTTHVSCGSLFGIGAVTGQARWGTIARILVAWIFTLPLAAILGACSLAAARALL